MNAELAYQTVTINQKNGSGKDREELQRQNIDIDIYEENPSFKIKKKIV